MYKYNKMKKTRIIIKNKVHPWALTGLIDAEGSLGISILKDTTRKTGYLITLFL